MNQREVIKKLDRIAENTTPKPSVISSAYSAEPQLEWCVISINCGAAARVQTLQPPPGMYYRIISINAYITTAAGSANNILTVAVGQNGSSSVIDHDCDFYARTPTLAVSKRNYIVCTRGSGYSIQDLGAENQVWYFFGWPSDLLIANNRPLIIKGQNVAGDYLGFRVIYEVLRER